MGLVRGRIGSRLASTESETAVKKKDVLQVAWISPSSLAHFQISGPVFLIFVVVFVFDRYLKIWIFYDDCSFVNIIRQLVFSVDRIWIRSLDSCYHVIYNHSDSKSLDFGPPFSIIRNIFDLLVTVKVQFLHFYLFIFYFIDCLIQYLLFLWIQ